MIGPADAMLLLAEYNESDERKHFQETFQDRDEMIKEVDTATTPHAYVLVCALQGVTRDEIIKEWDEYHE